MDITLLTSQGITPYEGQEIEYLSNPRNPFSYKIKFLKFLFDDQESKMIALFSVKRFYNSNTPDIEYTTEITANNNVWVDKFGIVVPEKITVEGVEISNPEAWGKEFDRIRILFNAPVPDSLIVEGYQQSLFDNGKFDQPKNRNV
jgi:hypothetical protein